MIMQLTDYTISDLKHLKLAVDTQISTVRIIGEMDLYDPDLAPSIEILESLTMWKVDIEQAIKDKQFERDQTTLDPLQ